MTRPDSDATIKNSDICFRVLCLRGTGLFIAWGVGFARVVQYSMLWKRHEVSIAVTLSEE